MPIKVICSRCGGLGTCEFFYLFEPHWRREPCPVCGGSGRIEGLSYQERKEKTGTDPPTPPDGGSVEKQ